MSTAQLVITGTAITGSAFNFGVFQDDGFTPLLTTQVDGYSIIVNLDNANGATAQTTTHAATISSAIPEPGTFVLFKAALDKKRADPKARPSSCFTKRNA